MVALVGPTMAPAWKIDAVNGDQIRGGGAGASRRSPAIRISPCRWVWSKGLPVGLSFIGPKWSEQLLLNLGYAYEQARGPFPTPQVLPIDRGKPARSPRCSSRSIRHLELRLPRNGRTSQRRQPAWTPAPRQDDAFVQVGGCRKILRNVAERLINRDLAVVFATAQRGRRGRRRFRRSHACRRSIPPRGRPPVRRPGQARRDDNRRCSAPSRQAAKSTSTGPR